MKISVNDKELFSLSDIQKKVICNDISSLEIDADLERRIKWVIEHKYEQCFARLKKEWDEKLAASGVDMIPTDKDAYAQLVFSQPGYMDRKTKEIESQRKIDEAAAKTGE